MPEKDSKPKEMVEMIYKQMAEITVVITQLIVEFAKQLWGFSTISKEDQIVLLKVRGKQMAIMMMIMMIIIEIMITKMIIMKVIMIIIMTMIF